LTRGLTGGFQGGWQDEGRSTKKIVFDFEQVPSIG